MKLGILCRATTKSGWNSLSFPVPIFLIFLTVWFPDVLKIERGLPPVQVWNQSWRVVSFSLSKRQYAILYSIMLLNTAYDWLSSFYIHCNRDLCPSWFIRFYSAVTGLMFESCFRRNLTSPGRVQREGKTLLQNKTTKQQQQQNITLHTNKQKPQRNRNRWKITSIFMITAKILRGCCLQNFMELITGDITMKAVVVKRTVFVQ